VYTTPPDPIGNCENSMKTGKIPQDHLTRSEVQGRMRVKGKTMERRKEGTMNEVITNNPQGWHEDWDNGMDIELVAEKYEELKRLEEEYKGYGWDEEEE